MIECKNLIHPFQHDPGMSQQQRVMDELLSGSPEIDGRSLADLLDYFVQLSRHINFYEEDLSISDWQPFFQQSLPFIIAGITKFDDESISENMAFYRHIFNQNPTSSGLQLLVHYLYYRVLDPLNTWQRQAKGSELPVAFALEKLIKDKLQLPVKEFVKHANSAVKWYGIKPVDWQRLHQNEVWGLYPSDLHESGDHFKDKGTTRRERIIALYTAIGNLAPAFLNVARQVADAAALSMDQSLVPLKAELREKHQPHLALLFAFLKLFRYLQNDLNSFTKKHLDFFYKQVLQLEPAKATPDKVHIVFEIQKQMDNYLLKEGLLVKDGKDANKTEVLFALDDEIVVNKTQVADKRTLFLNNQTMPDNTCVEGVYMAPDAGKADGIEVNFKENDDQSFATLGGKYSKYTDPEHGFIKPYPNARLGFILASPVLLLNEGKRMVNITLECKLKDNYCEDLTALTSRASDPCCEENGEEEFIQQKNRKSVDFKSACELYSEVEDILGQSFYYISQDLIARAQKKGASTDIIERLQSFLTTEKKICYCETDEVRYDTTVPSTIDGALKGFEEEFTAEEQEILAEWFTPRQALNISFSGEKEWIKPSEIKSIKVDPANIICDFDPETNSTYPFTLILSVMLEADKPAVTFYDKEKLKEDFNTTLPLVKIELDDKIKIESQSGEDLSAEANEDSHADEPDAEEKCCLERYSLNDRADISLYHFFRNVTARDTTIDVEVCGLKNFIVQNDESVQDVNSPIYPFGTRPEVPDFNLVNPPDTLLANPNLVGPDFYIGSNEVFGKKWENVYININWKKKPSSFEEYYKAYWADPSDSSNFGLKEEDFQINIAVLDNGFWREEKIHALDNPPPLPAGSTIHNPDTDDENRPLFKNDGQSPFCPHNPPAPAAPVVNPIEQTIRVSNTYFENYNQVFSLDDKLLTEYEVDSRFGFLKINLQNQDFLHKDYSFVLARQMMALGRYPDLIDGAIYIEGGNPQVFDISVFFGNLGPKVVDLANQVVNSAITHILDDLIDVITTEIEDTVPTDLINDLIAECKNLLDQVVSIDSTLADIAALFSGAFDVTTLSNSEINDINDALKTFIENLFNLIKTDLSNVEDKLKDKIKDRFDDVLVIIDTEGWFGSLFSDKEVPIPNEPWTPIIKNMSLDYTARAEITDIDLIHLYPYEGTYKPEELESQPTLLPTFCDEGTLFLGLEDLVPGSNVNMLFQLAEATADSELERQELHWYYLDNNRWKLLREGFEVLHDATDGLTSSGVIKFALPANMTADNTILPKGLHWIKAAIPQNSRSVSETIGIHTQAIQATFTNEDVNDKMRLAEALPAGSIAKLNEADSSVKRVNQPYDGFGGRLPEATGHFYVRVSELLRHKGRSIQKFDYERLALEAFPKLFKVKCINHSFGLNVHRYFNDFPMAPGYVLLAVIPDLNKLKAAASFEPRVPVSLLEKVKDYLRRRTSPFVRLKIMNPRYEKVHFCLKIKLYPGRDENFYKAKIKQDLNEFLAPWTVGQYDKLTFGQCIYKSDIVRFLESRDYLDYILDLRMVHENGDDTPIDQPKVCPVTPRSILIAGDIDVCILQQDCETWEKCYGDNRQEIDCCDHEKVAVADYCNEPEIIE